MKVDPGKVYIVGAGPGDPDLITVKGLHIIQQADLILYTDSLVNEALLASAKTDAEIFKSAGMHLEEIVEILVAAAKAGKVVARVHTGDPAVYGAILEQLARLKKAGVPYEIVPGVSSVFASAAVAGVELTVPDLCQTVILTRAEGRTPVPEREKLKDLAAHHCTLALFLSATLTGKLVEALRGAGWDEDTPILVVQRATWPDQKILRSTLARLNADMREAKIRSHAMILAGKALDPQLLDREDGYKSKLYDKTFTHRYRRGVTAGE
jgi:precorrin-4/cobalt-precorrin-4 C11-methyltransferase